MTDATPPITAWMSPNAITGMGGRIMSASFSTTLYYLRLRNIAIPYRLPVRLHFRSFFTLSNGCLSSPAGILASEFDFTCKLGYTFAETFPAARARCAKERLVSRCVQIVLLSCLFTGAAPQLWAEAPLETRSVAAVRTGTPPIIDGDLSDPAWEAAPLLEDFIDYDTFRVSAMETRVRILYDDDNIYVSFECMKDSAGVTATERKYDRFDLRRMDDYFLVSFDTFLDGIQAYTFLVNPLGTRWDGREGLYGRNQSWDAKWDASVKILPDRWVGEMAIPIGVMFFQRSDDQVWGINFRRRDRQQNKGAHWSLTDTTGEIQRGGGQKYVADFGRLEGLDLGKAKVLRRPELQTYVSATTTNAESEPNDLELRTGLDLSLRLNENWVGVVAINPDFGQVEADSGDIQNRDVERFLFERRPFFNEGAELFETPLIIYNSRNITDIASAVKLTGTGPGWTAGMLLLDGESGGSEEARFMVSRYTRQLGEKAQVGALFVGADRNNGFNWTGGADLQMWLPKNITWTTQALTMRDRKRVWTEDGYGNEFEVVKHKDAYALVSELDGDHRPFFWTLEYRDISADFRPDLGFISRRDIKGPSLILEYQRDALPGAVEEYNIEFEHQFYQNHAGDTVLRDFNIESRFQLRNKFYVGFSVRDDFHKPYDNRRNTVWAYYNFRQRYKSMLTSFSWGNFQDFDFEEIHVSKPFKIGDRLTNDIDITYRREHHRAGFYPVAAAGSALAQDLRERHAGFDQFFAQDLRKHYRAGFDRDVWLWRTEHEYTFKRWGRLKLTLEEASDNSYSRSLLYAYEDLGNWDFFFVLNDFRGKEQRMLRGAFTKFVYRF